MATIVEAALDPVGDVAYKFKGAWYGFSCKETSRSQAYRVTGGDYTAYPPRGCFHTHLEGAPVIGTYIFD